MDIMTLIAYVIAAAVPIFFLYIIFALDLYGTGKFNTVFVTFAWGALGAFSFALMLNNASIDYRLVTYDTVTHLTAPILEELLKSAMLVYLIRRPQFRYVVDGAIYGFAVGIGFAVSENMFYVYQNPNAGLVLSISRALSTTLMHATASGLVGVALGRLRRSQSGNIVGGSVAGLLLAVALHIGYNNLVGRLDGIVLLLVAIGIGLGGGGLIAVLINQGLNEEKKRFEQTLGTKVGVSSQERKAVQGLGNEDIEHVLSELAGFYGQDKADKIRRLLVIQANVGILNNNLSTPASERLRAAWQTELNQLRDEADALRNELGMYVMGFVRNLFPADENPDKPSLLNKATLESDTLVIHKFDIFMNTGDRVGTFSAEQMEEYAALLKQVEFFKEVELTDLENLSRAITSSNYQPGAVIFNQDDEGDTMYLIRRGAIDLITNDGGAERLLRTCQVGEVVGELALLDGQPRSAKAVANGNLTVLVLRRGQFTMFIHSRPMVVVALLQFLARRVRYVTELVEAGVSWAREVADGNYQQAAAVGGALAPSEGLPVVESVAPTKQLSSINRRESMTDVPVNVGGAFSRVAMALEQREQIAEKKLTDSSSLQSDLAHLPDLQREVVKFLMQDPSAAMTGISIALLQSKMPSIDGLPTIVEELTKNNWVVAMGAAPNFRYKVNMNRKRR